MTNCATPCDKSHWQQALPFTPFLYNGSMSDERERTQTDYWWKESALPASAAAPDGGYWWKETEDAEKTVCAIRSRPGQLCPECGQGTLAYNGLFVLTCPQCAYVAESGAHF